MPIDPHLVHESSSIYNDVVPHVDKNASAFRRVVTVRGREGVQDQPYKCYT